MTDSPLKAVSGTLPKCGAILSAVALLIFAAFYLFSPKAASVHYLVSFMLLVSIALGSLFFVALEHLVSAVWSTPLRRVPEFLSGIVPYLILVALPLCLLGLDLLYVWLNPEYVQSSYLVSKKGAYLNLPFFLIRVGICLLVWFAFYRILTRNSYRQDETKDPALSTSNVRWSAAFFPVFAITISVAAIDWLMSLSPEWFSTMFGVYYFGGSMVAALATITLIVVLLFERKWLHPKVTTDHLYSLGGLLFGFNCFWAYVAFSQFMLIWYANIPDEIRWYVARWHQGPWAYLAITLVIFHFIVPFFVLVSREAKTNPTVLKIMSVWLLIMHLADLYFLVLPSFSLSIVELAVGSVATILLPIGITLIAFGTHAQRRPLTPIGDPKLSEGLAFHL